jgi:large subunit ribosomal protein L22
MEAIAKTRNLKGSPQKTRLVIDMIRGRNVSQALAILQFTNKRAAKPIAKCLRSAIANATYKAEQQNIAIDPDDLWVRTCFVDMGVHKNRRRLRPAPQGRAYQEQRHYCHITIEVSSESPEKPVVKLKKNGNKVDAEKIKLREESAEKRKKAKSADKPKKEDKTAEKSEPKVAKEEVVVEKPNVEIPDAEVSEVKEAKTEEIVKEETQVEEKSSEETVEIPVVEAKKEVPADNKPFAAQTDEEKTDTKKAADAQIDENEELEKQ